MLISTETQISGKRMRGSEMPAAFMASSSFFSPMPPRVMMEASRVASGRAIGISVQAAQPRNSKITPSPSPFPTNSSI